ncbi:hypothetical protein EVAR_64358_1 [Eumeta japonica]|uniref:Uncharacterized protein n=1 Tax=Eumeta variegata TaxID=151549 RepID=A0A4C1ZMF0_EUMVA|nr:hypothetical protein EVAR_64358_1 [Eumeta japonica]
MIGIDEEAIFENWAHRKDFEFVETFEREYPSGVNYMGKPPTRKGRTKSTGPASHLRKQDIMFEVMRSQSRPSRLNQEAVGPLALCRLAARCFRPKSLA